MDIEQKVKELLDNPETRKEILGYEELDTSPKKLIDCAHEIVFTVEANILQQNEKGENTTSSMIHKRNFHMPVPQGNNPAEYMEVFLKHFEECLINTHSKTEEEKK